MARTDRDMKIKERVEKMTLKRREEIANRLALEFYPELDRDHDFFRFKPSEGSESFLWVANFRFFVLRSFMSQYFLKQSGRTHQEEQQTSYKIPPKSLWMTYFKSDFRGEIIQGKKGL